jgi:hypothetical protein
VIAFDGQPFYQNICNTSIPPGTSPNICPWTVIGGNPTCTGPAPLSVTGAVVLPVTLTDFTASARSNDVVLNWKTAQETNNKGFTVQRSPDGQHWTDLGFVAGAINSSAASAYQYIDNLPNAGVNFYRLRQEDLDGRTSFSAVVTADFKSNKFFTVSDNPGNGVYKINVVGGNGLTELDVTDATGRIISREKTTNANTIVDLSRQAPGLYWLRIKKGTNLASVKLIKL